MNNIMDKFSLDGKIIVVTGAGAGIGKAVSQGLMETGATVVFTDVNEEHAKAAAAEGAALSPDKGASMGLRLDVTDPAEIESVFKTVHDKYDKIDVLYNNAGIAMLDSMLVDQDPKDIAFQLNVNTNGTIFCTREALKYMMPAKSGSIINVASMSAHIYNVPQRAAYYAASKGAIIGFTRSMGAEVAPYGVRVNCISPGYHMSEMAAQWTDVHPIWLERVPMGRFAQPREMTTTVIYLASEASGYMTGAEIVVDGGYTLW